MPSIHKLPLLSNPSTTRASKRGSALLLTILVVSLLVVLALAFSAYVRIQYREVQNHQHQTVARRNAQLALQLAIAQLQQHTGPDQRVTGQADIEIPTNTTINPDLYNVNNGLMTSRGTTGAEAVQMIDSYWSERRNRHWVGAWRNTNTTTYNPNAPPDFNPEPGLQSWLVSGNESNPLAFTPTVSITGLTASSTPGDELTDADGRPHRLLVKSVAGVNDSPSLTRAVTAPQVNITSPDGAASGRYAWWVGDEGIKARANLIDPYAEDPSNEGSRIRRQSAQRPVIEAMTRNPNSANPDEAGLASFYPANDPALHSVITPAQFGFLDNDTEFRTQLEKRYHELTLYSRGVLADTKNGGLKGDLSHILSRSGASAFHDALGTAFRGENVAPHWQRNLAISTAATPYAEFPTFSGYDGYGSGDSSHLEVRPLPSDLMHYTLSWEQIWSYFNMGNHVGDFPPGVFNGGVAQARLPNPTQHGLTPILMQGKVFYRLHITGGTVHVDVNPLVVLANPYPVPLAGDFTIRYTISGSPRVVYGTPDSPAPSDQEIRDAVDPSEGGTELGGDLRNAYLGEIRLVARATGIPPGEAQIFTVDPNENLQIASNTDSREVTMIASYDPTVFLTYDTGRSLPDDPNMYVGLFSSGGIRGAAYMGNITETTRFAQIATRHSAHQDDISEYTGFRVFPFRAEDGARSGGGGLFFSLHDGYNVSPHQSPFLQLNYRSMLVDYMGASYIHGHPLQWSIFYSFPGERDQPYENPPPGFQANILLPPSGPGIPNTTRWGLVNTGGFPSLTTAPPGVDGFGNTGLVNLLYDIPRPGQPVTSLGQLQHVNLSGPTAPSASNIRSNSWQLNYPISNSYATPRVPRDLTFFSSSHLGAHYDGAYMLNDILWDRFTFSSFPSEGSFDFDDPSDQLINSRYRPFRNPFLVPRDDPDQFRGVFAAAENLLVEGAFNINSTSVEAWKAVLSGLRDVPIGNEDNPDNLHAPFTRTLSPATGADGAELGNTENAWAGFRNLTEAELQAIAEEMVLQVRLRGPFLSLSQFVNRKLTKGRLSVNKPLSPDVHMLGLRGALQAAIDKVINQQDDVSNASTGPGTSFQDKTRAWAPAAHRGPFWGDVDYRASNRISGFPGYLLQGDVLSAIGPNLTARSDTFIIRTYGDVVSSDGHVQARAWCEAVVQRLPDYVEPADAPSDAATHPINQRLGRRYHVISFRWLNPEDI